jgi:hypothetical protein
MGLFFLSSLALSLNASNNPWPLPHGPEDDNKAWLHLTTQDIDDDPHLCFQVYSEKNTDWNELSMTIQLASGSFDTSSSLEMTTEDNLYHGIFSGGSQGSGPWLLNSTTMHIDYLSSITHPGSDAENFNKNTTFCQQTDTYDTVVSYAILHNVLRPFDFYMEYDVQLCCRNGDVSDFHDNTHFYTDPITDPRFRTPIICNSQLYTEMNNIIGWKFGWNNNCGYISPVWAWYTPGALKPNELSRYIMRDPNFDFETTFTSSPVVAPSLSPTNTPLPAPTNAPSLSPTNAPSHSPTNAPTNAPTFTPTHTSCLCLSKAPTTSPTQSPANVPTESPTTVSPTPVATIYYVEYPAGWNTIGSPEDISLDDIHGFVEETEIRYYYGNQYIFAYLSMINNEGEYTFAKDENPYVLNGMKLDNLLRTDGYYAFFPNAVNLTYTSSPAPPPPPQSPPQLRQLEESIESKKKKNLRILTLEESIESKKKKKI